MKPGYSCNIGYSSETHLKLNSREISLVKIIHFSCQIVLKICTEHNSDTAVLFAKFLNNLTNEQCVMGKRDFARYKYVIYICYIYMIHFGRIYNVATDLRLYSTHRLRRHMRQLRYMWHIIVTGISVHELFLCFPGFFCWHSLMTSSNENIFRVTGPLYGEFSGHRWIPLTKACDAELWCFLWSMLEQTVE